MKEKEEILVVHENNIRKDKESLHNMQLKINEELRQLNIKRKELEGINSTNKYSFHVNQ